MGLSVAIVLALGLVSATVLIHYEALRAIHRLVPQVPMLPRKKILLVIGGIMLAHVAEICLYALAFFMMHRQFGVGSIAGKIDGGWHDYFYFSASTYATLGLGDVAPLGPLRIVAGIEALNGLVLIGWSTSYTYLTIRNAWERGDGTSI